MLASTSHDDEIARNVFVLAICSSLILLHQRNNGGCLLRDLDSVLRIVEPLIICIEVAAVKRLLDNISRAEVLL